MNRIIIISFVCFAIISGCVDQVDKCAKLAQVEDFKPITEQTTRLIADHIIANTSFTVVNTETGEQFAESEKLPVEASYKVESPYNEWKYWNGVLNLAMIELGRATGEEGYIDFARQNYEFIFDHLDYFEKQYEKQFKKSSFYLYFRMSRLDDCGAMAAGLAEVYEHFDNEILYRQYLDRTADFIENREVRMADRTIVRPKPREMTLWADDLYMSVPFLARMYHITGQEKYLDDAVLLIKNFHSYLYRESNGLYYHAWYSDNQQNGIAHWGRSNGWVAMAHVELLSMLPKDHSSRDELIGLLEDHIAGLARHQSYTGMWHQVLDRPDSYLESSATAMFSYAIARAVNQGWIQPSYAGIAINGWQGLQSKIRPDGQVEEICIGTGIEDNIQFYFDRPTLLNDIHGLGAVILAGVEISKLGALLKKLEEEKLRLKAEKVKNQKK